MATLKPLNAFDYDGYVANVLAWKEIERTPEYRAWSVDETFRYILVAMLEVPELRYPAIEAMRAYPESFPDLDWHISSIPLKIELRSAESVFSEVAWKAKQFIRDELFRMQEERAELYHEEHGRAKQ